MAPLAHATAFCVCSFHRTQMRKVPHKNVVMWQKVPNKNVVMWRKVPHKNVKGLFLSLIISIFAAYRINDSLLWKDL
jgi:hypothetical protein